MVDVSSPTVLSDNYRQDNKFILPSVLRIDSANK